MKDIIKKGDVVYLRNEEGWTRKEYQDESKFINGRKYVVTETHTTSNRVLLMQFGEENLVELSIFDEYDDMIEWSWFPLRLLSTSPPSDLPERQNRARQRRM